MKKLLLSGIIAASTMFSCGTQKNLVSSARIDNTSKTYVDMNLVRESLREANKIKYEYDESSHPDKFICKINSKTGVENEVYDYWQSPEETDSLKTGDCDDQVIRLYNSLKTKGIYSELAFGVINIGDEGGHVWSQIVSNDTTYIVDPTFYFADSTIYFRSNNKIKNSVNGNIAKQKYLLWDYNGKYKMAIDYNLNDYISRTGDTLKIANKSPYVKKTPKRLLRKLERANNR